MGGGWWVQEEKRQLRSMFDSLDVSHDGQISASELRSGLQRVGVSCPRPRMVSLWRQCGG